MACPRCGKPKKCVDPNCTGAFFGGPPPFSDVEAEALATKPDEVEAALRHAVDTLDIGLKALQVSNQGE